METRWSIKEKANELAIVQLSQQLNNLDPFLCNLLLQRGIDTFDKAKSFFRSSLEETHDPFLMKDMDKAVDRILTAIAANEKILIYGDYDVDGTTSVTLVYGFLSNFYTNLTYYIPDRYNEGYGISYIGIDYAADNDISLVIALDCGIKAIEKIDYAKEKGVDFIICDHHLPGEKIPKAIAVLDPKRSDCEYPFKELSGCGVGYKLMEAIAVKKAIPTEELHAKLDILAVSICADIVPMVGENRIFTHMGIKKLNTNPQPGFEAMLTIANNKKKELTVTDVVFSLAPRINAAGRIESGNKAVEVMLSLNAQSAMEGGNHIDGQNTDRKELDRSITEEALKMIEEDSMLKNQKTTVLYNENWHKGVIGIVASRCIESYYRPTIILTKSKDMAAGSARSVKGFSVYNAIEQCADLLEQFGGHKYAAGMTLKIENIPAFQQKFEKVVSESIPPELLIPEVEIDCELALSAINKKFFTVLKQFAPYGPQNMKPVFATYNVKEKGQARIVGTNHLKLDIIDPQNPEKSYPAIGFNLGQHLNLIKSGEPFQIAYSIEENEWRGNTTLQLNIKDIKSNLSE